MACKEISELYRISTFATWTSTISPFSLARSGLSYLGKNDKVRCFACNTDLDGWNANDDPLERHRQSAPNCPFLKGDATGNVALKINHSDGNYATSQTTTDNAELDVDRAVLQDNRLDNLTKVYFVVRDRARKKGLFSSDNDLQLDPPDFDKLRQEAERLRTFHNWPASAQAEPEALARVGLFYTGTVDRVQCAFCRGFMLNWVSTDIPEVEHKRHCPQCSFVRGIEVGNIPLVKNSEAAAPKTTNQCDGQIPTIQNLVSEAATTRLPKTTNQCDGQNPAALNLVKEAAAPNLVRETTAIRAPGQIQSLAVPIFTNAKYPDYADVKRRIQSFKNGVVSRGQIAECLADAGWYHIGPGDKVYCFQCGGNLKDWEPEDDPWEEHQKWYPNCPYIKTHIPRSRAQIQQALQVGAVYRPEPREVKARMDTPTVRAILEMGYARDLVRMAIENRLSTAGDDFPNAESLLEAVLQLEETGTQSKAPAIAAASNYATETLSMTSGYNSIAPVSTVPAIQSSNPSNQPDSASLPPPRSAFTADTIALSQSMVPASQEKQAASAAVAMTTRNELVAEGQAKAKGKRKRNKKKKTIAASFGDDDQSVEMPVLAKNDQEKVEEDNNAGDANLDDVLDEEAMKYYEENRQLREARTCKVCMDKEVNTVFLPCGHLVCCSDCSPQLRNCPICRTFIRGTVKTFLS